MSLPTGLDSGAASRSLYSSPGKVKVYVPAPGFFNTSSNSLTASSVQSANANAAKILNNSVPKLNTLTGNPITAGFVNSKITIPDNSDIMSMGKVAAMKAAAQKTAAQKAASAKKPKGAKPAAKPDTKVKSTALPPSNPNDYKWNLPPHKWSMPKSPTQEDMPDGYSKDPVDNRYRRGRLWWKYNDATIMVETADKKPVSSLSSDLAARQYGFQFLWNPESFSTQTAVQMEATPTAGDAFLSGAGFFPATETISFNIRIDRTNDFAAAVGQLSRPSNMIIYNKKQVKKNTFVSAEDITEDMIAGYSASYFLGSDKADMRKKLADLYQRGTIADVEYLYRAINGKGPGGSTTWFNGRGIETADIGFLMPTLLNVDIGPLSYAGYVTSLGVNHIAFTQDMIPIRTDVTVSLNLLATAGLTGGTS